MQNSSDNKNKNFIKEAYETLKYFYNFPTNEIPLKEVEKFIFKKLRFEKRKSKVGSGHKYYHPDLKSHPVLYSDGTVSIHDTHKNPRNPKIRKKDFRYYLYPAIKEVINIEESKNV